MSHFLSQLLKKKQFKRIFELLHMYIYQAPKKYFTWAVLQKLLI